MSKVHQLYESSNNNKLLLLLFHTIIIISFQMECCDPHFYTNTQQFQHIKIFHCSSIHLDKTTADDRMLV